MAQTLPVSCAQKSSRNAPLCVMTDVVSASVPQHGDDLRGPWFSAEQQASMQSLGQWSDSFCSCLADKKMGLLSFLCSWYVVFITMQKIGTVSTVCGPLTKERFGFALVIFVLLWALLRSVTSSFVGHLGLCPVILLYLAVLRGIRDKIGVKEIRLRHMSEIHVPSLLRCASR